MVREPLSIARVRRVLGVVVGPAGYAGTNQPDAVLQCAVDLPWLISQA